MRKRLVERVKRVLRWLNGEKLGQSGKMVVPTQDLPMKNPEDIGGPPQGGPPAG